VEFGMQFGTFYQLPCAENQSPVQRYEETLIQIQHADALGVDIAWLAELHFFSTFSIMPSPLLVASALAQRTRRIRLGIAVNLLPLHNPLRNAEDAATLDILSNGRLEYGAGRGSIPLHFSGFNVSLEESRQRFLEALDVVLLAWTSETFSYDGKFHQYYDVKVVPKPVQQPHPPIRIACNSSESFQLAGERGWRVFSSPVVVPMSRLKEDIATYHAQLNAHATPRHGDEVALMAPVYVSPSASKAREHPEASITSYFGVLQNMYSTPQAKELARHNPRMQEMQERLKSMTYDHMLENFAIFGEPAFCIDRIQWLKETFGISQFICWFNTGGKIPHQQVMESMTLFAEQVMPYID
jgi:alkanesulfonate monooxygenase SsuD/methylene tetrahydromethanopterin reductase-like flavin-dependent oxidoreductase (luciferase family)